MGTSRDRITRRGLSTHSLSGLRRCCRSARLPLLPAAPPTTAAATTPSAAAAEPATATARLHLRQCLLQQPPRSLGLRPQAELGAQGARG
jgi:hypothetical protein